MTVDTENFDIVEASVWIADGDEECFHCGHNARPRERMKTLHVTRRPPPDYRGGVIGTLTRFACYPRCFTAPTEGYWR